MISVSFWSISLQFNSASLALIYGKSGMEVCFFVTFWLLAKVMLTVTYLISLGPYLQYAKCHCIYLKTISIRIRYT